MEQHRYQVYYSILERGNAMEKTERTASPIDEFINQIKSLLATSVGDAITQSYISDLKDKIIQLAVDNSINLRSKPSIESLHNRLIITINLDMEQLYIEIYNRETYQELILRTDHVI